MNVKLHRDFIVILVILELISIKYHQSVMAGGIFMEEFMVELYFSIKAVLLIAGILISTVYVVYELWKWFH